MKNYLTTTALALAGLSFSTSSVFAALSYSNGDLLLGFRASGGDGAPRDYVVNIGPASQFLSGTGTVPVSGLSGIGTDLTSTGANGLFGPTWNTRGDVSWGIVGTDLAADPANTLYATRAQTVVGTQALPWDKRTNSGQSTTNSILRSYILGYLNSTANAAEPKGTIQATSFANSYASFTVPNVDFGFFANVEGNFQNGAAGSVLDLFRVTPGSGGSQHLGQFTISSTGTLSFTFDNVTLTPTLSSPATNGIGENPLAVSFNLPETAQPGSLKLAFSGAASSVLTLTASQETPTQHTFGFNPANPLASASIASGSAIPDGYYTVTLSYQDSIGNAAATAQSTNVLVDTAAPVVDASGVATTGYSALFTLPDLRPSVSATDANGATVVQSPAPGSTLTIGSFPVTFTATDPAGHHTSSTVTLTVEAGNPSSSVLVAKSGPVPGTGVTGSGVPVGATFASFGVPAINDAGAVAYLAKWKAVPKTGAGGGIFAGNPVALVTKIGDPVPSLTGVTFKAFKDPVINQSGAVAIVATIQGTGVTTATNQVIVTNAFAGGALTLVAQSGTPSTENGGALFRSFTDVSLQGAEVLFTAKLIGGTPAVVTANDAAAYAATASSTKHVVREGDTFGASSVKSFKLLGAVGGSANQTRGHSVGNASFLVVLANGTQALVDGDGTTLDAFAATGDLTGGTTLPAAKFKTFGIPAVDGAQEAVAANLTPGVGTVTSANARGIFLGTGSAFEPVVRITAPAPGVANSVFSVFSDPLLADGAVAFPAKTKDLTTKLATASLWWKPASGPLALIAGLADQPAEIPAGAKWKKFGPLALAGGTDPSPIFYAQLLQGAGGVTAANDYGVWAVDRAGHLRLLVREADVVDGKTVKAITVLGAISGSNGVTHSFNNTRKLIYRASFTDGSTGIATTTIP